MYYLRHIALGQCWPIGIFCLMLYNQSNFYIFEETSNYWSRVFSKIFIGQVSISLLSLVTIWVVHSSERTDTRLMTESDRNGTDH